MDEQPSLHRKSVVATAALTVVLAADKEQGLNWGGVDIDGYLVWIFVGVAHLYFTIMWWTSFGFQGWFPWNDGWRGTLRLRPRKELIRRFMNDGPFTMFVVIVGFSIITYQLGKITLTSSISPGMSSTKCSCALTTTRESPISHHGM